MAINRRTLRLLRQLRVAVGEQADQTTRSLTRAWVRAWDELAAGWRAGVADAVTWSVTNGRWPQPWEIARIERLMNALVRSEQALATLGERTGVLVTDGAGTVVAATAAAEPAIIASQLPAALQDEAIERFAARLLPTALDAIVARTAEQITAVTRLLAPAATEAMRRELIRGIAVGDNPRTTARAMVNRVQGTFEGGLTRAVNIARTEQLDAYRTTSRHAHTANSDVLAGWTWHATLDRRTCPSCWAMHGTVHPIEQPGPWDHQQGRCARVPKTKSWRELGINLDEPPDLTPDAQARFWALPHADRLAIMGPARLELLRSGRVDFPDLAVRRSTPAWRDSYTPRPVADLRRIADQRAAAGITPRPHPAAPKTPPPAPEPTVRDLLRRAGSQEDVDVAPFRPIYEGTFAGLRTELTSAARFEIPEVSGVLLSGGIRDADGVRVGHFERLIGRGGDGKLIAYHAELKLLREVQGSGFAQAFNRRLIDWYRRSGVDRVELQANIDVGGYAWARAGYDWANAQTAQSIAFRASAMVDRVRNSGNPAMLLQGAPDVDAQLAAAEALLKRWATAKFGTVDYPSAYELSQLGRWPGAGKDDIWIGKLVLLGSYWEGVLRL